MKFIKHNQLSNCYIFNGKLVWKLNFETLRKWQKGCFFNYSYSKKIIRRRQLKIKPIDLKVLTITLNECNEALQSC